MSVFALTRKEKAGCDNNILSFICGDGIGCLSVVEKNFHLPYTFDWDESLSGGSCGEWSYLYGCKGAILVWNLLTPKLIRLLDPPDCNFSGNEAMMEATGLGYDAKSHHYTVIRHYVEYHYINYEDGKSFDGFTEHFEVCILEHPFHPVWNVIEGPDFCSDFSGAGVYLNATGRCYWTAYYEFNYDEFQSRQELTASGSPDNQFVHVVSFDFTTKRFNKLPFPAATDLGRDLSYRLVVCHGSLGALVYNEMCPSSSGLSIQLHVWCLQKRKWSWKRLYTVSRLANVARPIPGGLKDNRFVFLESKPSDGKRSQLLVYDFKAKMEEKLEIYDKPGFMQCFSYAESSGPPLPVLRRKRSRKVKMRKMRRKSMSMTIRNSWMIFLMPRARVSQGGRGAGR